MIVAKINVTRIEKAHLYAGRSGKYLDIAFHENKDGEDQFGNIGFITQSVSKEARERGEKGPIIGNWKEVGAKKRSEPSSDRTPRPAPEPEDDDIPF